MQKSTAKRYGAVALLLVGITAVGALLTLFTGTVQRAEKEKTVLTTTWPLYAAVKNLTVGVDGVRVENLTGASTGCLHDYQLSPANRISLEGADLVVLNGAGAESFLTDVLPELMAAVVDTSEGISLLTSDGHAHEGHGHDYDHDHTDNEHIWVSPARYALQVTAVERALSALDGAHAAAYQENAAVYRERIRAVEERLTTAANRLGKRSCVLFHDSLAYLVEDLGFQATVTLSAGEEGGVSAGALAEAERTVAANPTALIFYDSQYTARYGSVERLVDACQVLVVDTGVNGAGADSWLTAMEKTAALLEACGRENE